MNLDTIKAQLRKRHNLPDDAPVGVKWCGAQIKADDERHDPYAFTARINVDTLDRDNEVVLPEGVDLREFDKSGAGFFNHDYSRVPVFVPGPVKMQGGALVGKGKFLKNELAEDVREFVHAMAAAGKSAGVSIGFMPTGSREPSKKDVERYGGNVSRVWTNWKLFEWSIAPVQSNPEAVVVEIGKAIKARVAKSLYGIEPLIAPAPKRVYVIQAPAVKAAPAVSRNKIIAVATAKAVARMQGRLYV